MKFWSNSDVPQSAIFVPEMKLLAAVLQRAIADLVSGDEEVQDTTRQWFLEQDDSDSPLTYSFICEALELDPEKWRKAIFLQQQKATESESPSVTQ
jgi:hypothetical protein